MAKAFTGSPPQMANCRSSLCLSPNWTLLLNSQAATLLCSFFLPSYRQRQSDCLGIIPQCQRDKNLFDFTASSVASRILRVARLNARAAVPPVTRPPPPGFLLLGSSSWKSVAEFRWRRHFSKWVAPEAKTCQYYAPVTDLKNA